MKVIILLVLVVGIFFCCATFGFQMAGFKDLTSQAPQVVETNALNNEQHNIVIIGVDQLDSGSPRLISVWFVSFFFGSNQPSSLTLAQLYPTKEPRPNAQSLERAFSLDSNGEPVSGFWYALDAYKIQWEAYVMMDHAGGNEALNWLFGAGDYYASLDAAQKNADENWRLVNQICGSIVNAKDKDLGLFNWSKLVPQHFRSNLRMETGLAYWSRITNAGSPVRCEIIMAP
jgi:hypothetical protein